ncbi:MAG TPA: glycoside hydrolase family 172 protein [Planctomycetota bacterium]|nr:glycoside hydrolase family 172 protein [Planctomycetota bacterium]
MSSFNGLGMGLGNLSRVSRAKSRSICAENFTGEKGKAGMATEGTGARCARDLGQGWKVSPSVRIKAGETFTLAHINGSGAVQHMWISGDVSLKGPGARFFILRIYWDGQEQPSVECPVADFFASGWGVYAQINSLPVAVNPNRAYNCYWEMPFRKECRITLENRHNDDITCYYQIDYTLTDVPDDAAHFHAQFRRVNPLPYKQVSTIVDGVRGTGQYVGTALAWGVNNTGWWGEGEIKFYLDGDGEFPTICGTGTEDYFGGCYNWDVAGQYTPYSTPFLGMQVFRPDGAYRSQMRFAMYRWHVMDPIRFERDLRVTIQALGWRDGGRYLPLQDDIASVAFWYQMLPTAPFPKLPDRDTLEII